MTTMTEVRIRRSFDVPAQRIYDAWTDPEQIPQWLTLGGTYEGAVRVGGKFQINMIDNGEVKTQTGTYLHLDPPHLIEFTWFSACGTYGKESLVRIDITDLGSSCEMVLTHTKLPDDQIQGHIEGWTMFSELLAKQVGST